MYSEALYNYFPEKVMIYAVYVKNILTITFAQYHDLSFLHHESVLGIIHRTILMFQGYSLCK